MAKASAFWVRLNTDIWDDNDAIKVIDAMPDGDSILMIFFKLVTHAGKSNADGQLLINGFIPLEPDMLPGIVKRTQEQVDRAVEVLSRFGLLYTSEGLEIADWHEWVNVDVMAKIREQNNDRVRRHREKKAGEMKRYSNVSETYHVTDDRELENKELENKDLKDYAPAEPDPPPEPEKIPYAEIIDHLNGVCGTAFKNAGSHQRHIKARWNEGHRVEDFKHVIDVMFAEWGQPRRGEKDMRPYLRPETLFGPKFDGYKQKRTVKGGGDDDGGNKGGPGSSGLASYVIE